MPDTDDATMPTMPSRIEQLEDEVSALKGKLTRMGHVLARYAQANRALITENLRLHHQRERHVTTTRIPRAD